MNRCCQSSQPSAQNILLLQSLSFQSRLYSNGPPHEIVCGSKLPSRAISCNIFMRSQLAVLVLAVDWLGIWGDFLAGSFENIWFKMATVLRGLVGAGLQLARLWSENTSRLAGHSSLRLLIRATYSLKQDANEEVYFSVVSIENTVHSNAPNSTFVG